MKEKTSDAVGSATAAETVGGQHGTHGSESSGGGGIPEKLGARQRLKHFNGMLVFVMVYVNPGIVHCTVIEKIDGKG